MEGATTVGSATTGRRGRWRAALVAAGAACLVAGCSGTSGDPSADAGTFPSTAAPATSAPATAPASASPATSEPSATDTDATASGATDNHDIYRLGLDGSEPVRLTDDPRVDGAPSWSPDGSRIAFGRVVAGDADSGTSEIFVMAADGSDVRQVTFDGRHNWHPSWSPDGSQIAFDRMEGGQGEVHVMDADGSNSRMLVASGELVFGPSWSPDGSSIAYSSAGAIWVTTVDGTTRRELTGGPRHAAPTWSTDGRTLVFEDRPTDDGGRVRVATVGVDASGPPVELPSPRALAWPIRGSVDDEVLAVDLVESELYLVGLDGVDRLRLTTDQYADALGAQPWEPSRRALVYESARPAT